MKCWLEILKIKFHVRALSVDGGIELKKIKHQSIYWIHLVMDTDQWQVFVDKV
jgi:hypothetical protein